jgi:tetratricopeptide (TPR) repeat protein
MGSAVVDDRQLLQAELARVNLLRIRGDLSSSKNLCLSVLKRFPESIDAHVMMGDLHSEQGDLAPAAEWYSLALDLDRNAPGVAVKLSRVQAALDISGQASKSRIMIANGKRMSPWLYVAVAASAIAIIAVGYIAGMGTTDKTVAQKSAISDRIESPKSIDATPKTSDTNTPITVPSPASINPLNNTRGPEPSVTNNVVPETKSTGTKETAIAVNEDQKLYDQVSNRSKFGKHVISILADPRERSMILTYNVTDGEHGRYLGAILADVALEYDARVLQVTIRGVRNGVLSYVADVPREKIMAVEAREKKNVQDLEDKNWIDEVLTNEYFKGKEMTKPSSI